MNRPFSMLKLPALLPAVLCCFIQSLSAGETSTNLPDWTKIDTESTQKSASISHEAKAEYSFVGSAQLRQGDHIIGNTNEQTSSFSYTASIPVSKGWQLRAGLDWERFSFGNPGGAPVPDTLQSTALVIGADVELSEKWLMRFEIHPGIYSDFEDIDSNDFHVPAILGFSYIVDSKLQWIFGLQISYFDEYPILPAVGVRWQFADDWTLNFIPPRPRLEYRINEQLETFAGAEIKTGSYRTGSDFGTNAGNPALNNAVVSYMEIRAGAGLIYRFHPAVALEAEGGWMVNRSFDYYRADTKIKGEGAAYGQIGLKAAF